MNYRSLAAIATLALLGACASAPPPLAEVTATTARRPHASQEAFDVAAYDLRIAFHPKREEIEGVLLMTAAALGDLDAIALDLDPRFEIGEVLVDGAPAPYAREDGRVVATASIAGGASFTVRIAYAGAPHQAARPPWDGGVTWAKTPSGAPWIATSVQGEGCDLWWPCKDQFDDKPDEMSIAIDVPAGLIAASNGLLQSVETVGDRTVYSWKTAYPLTPYNVAVGVGPYEVIEETFASASGVDVPVSLWILPEYVEDGRRLMADLLRQLAYFEGRLGPYPWAKEKVGIVHTPFLGMEHQSINAYGSSFGVDPHGYDWLLQHELSHEWFGNAMTHARAKDFWLHEGFATYMQADYAAEVIGDFSREHYLYEFRLNTQNCSPVVPSAPDGRGWDVGTDVYYKGAGVLHTLRLFIGEAAFWSALRGLIGDDPGRVFRTTDDFIRIASEAAGRDLSWFFAAYLDAATLPRLLVERTDGVATFRWETASGAPFRMPVDIEIDGATRRLAMRDGEEKVDVPDTARLRIDPKGAVLRELPIRPACGS